MCKLTLSGAPRPFCSILCDSLTPHPPSGIAALCMEVGFNNFSLGKFRERERASEKASNYLTPFSEQVMQVQWHLCSRTNARQQNAFLPPANYRKVMGDEPHFRNSKKCNSKGNPELSIIDRPSPDIYQKNSREF